jgi:hypothetical protein
MYHFSPTPRIVKQRFYFRRDVPNRNAYVFLGLAILSGPAPNVAKEAPMQLAGLQAIKRIKPHAPTVQPCEPKVNVFSFKFIQFGLGYDVLVLEPGTLIGMETSRAIRTFEHINRSKNDAVAFPPSL